MASDDWTTYRASDSNGPGWRLLNEVFMLMEYVSAQTDQSISDLKIPDATGGQVALPSILADLNKMQEEGSKRKFSSAELGLLQLVRDALTLKCAPATSRSIGYTELYLGGVRSLGANGRGYADIAFPNLLSAARWHRVLNVAMMILALMVVSLAVYRSVEAALGKHLVDARQELRKQKTELQIEKKRLEARADKSSDWRRIPLVTLTGLPGGMADGGAVGGNVPGLPELSVGLNVDLCDRPAILASWIDHAWKYPPNPPKPPAPPEHPSFWDHIWPSAAPTPAPATKPTGPRLSGPGMLYGATWLQTEAKSLPTPEYRAKIGQSGPSGSEQAGVASNTQTQTAGQVDRPGLRLMHEDPEQLAICSRDAELRAGFRESTNAMWRYLQNWRHDAGGLFRGAGILKSSPPPLPCENGTTECLPSDDHEYRIAPRILVIGNFLLPVIFAFLGAAAYVVVDIYMKIRSSTLTPHDRVLGLVRLVLGVILGTCIGLFFSSGAPPPTTGSGAGKPPTDLLAGLTLSASTIAFLAGFGVEGVFNALRELVTRVFPSGQAK
jgi:hypothetical protein